MRDKKVEEENFNNRSTIYGPVKSWRYGMSLGVDPIFVTSTCSFNCIYCQLGHIQNVTREIKEYVPTQKVVNDYIEFLTKKIHHDVVTFSGSGEPTLASNLGEMQEQMKLITPQVEFLVLTNSTELQHPNVRENLKNFDRVIVKIDASDEKTFTQVNRPANGITLKSTIDSIVEFKKTFPGILEVQSMFMPINQDHLDHFAEILKRVSPAVVQLNTPKRPYPMEWHRENRGNHKLIFDYDTRELKKVTIDQAKEIEDYLKEKTGLVIHSVYQ